MLGINGFGRIGRLALRIGAERGYPIAAVNVHNANPEYMAYLLKHDTVHGRLDKDVGFTADSLLLDGKRIRVFSGETPAEIPWGEAGAEYILETTGKFNKLAQASLHIHGGVKKVVISAPSADAPMFVMGVNHKSCDRSMKVVSNASCTTNCLAPMAKILNDGFGIVSGLMTTVHSVTSSQRTVDGTAKKEWRSGRAAFDNIIPATTGAASAVGKVIPELQGKLTGMSLRVPTLDVSIVDLTVLLQKETNLREICSAFKAASEGEMKGIVGYTEDPVVSSDFRSDPRTCIFDATAGMQLGGCFFKLFGWYDNEYGYASKLLDLANHIFDADNA